MKTRRGGAGPVSTESPYRRSRGIPARTQHWAGGAFRRLQIFAINTRIAAGINVFFGLLQLFTGGGTWWIGLAALATAAAFLATPRLYRYGDLVGPMTFLTVAYVLIFVVTWTLGTGSGLQFYFLAAATTAVLTLGTDHMTLAATTAAVGAGLAVVLEFSVPADTGVQPAWAQTLSAVLTIPSACFMVVAVTWYALRELARAEMAMEAEYERSESLLDNILPATIAKRLKEPGGDLIADKYDEASVLFADIADFTEHASDVGVADLVRFLNVLYTSFDLLAEQHGLEKVKTTGDAYMVVSGVPVRQSDHLEALADLALDMADAAATVTDPHGCPLRLRIGVSTGPVVAGVVGTRRFFYDVWGDAVNVAARMESTGTEGRIQVTRNVYERLRHDFVFEERGNVDIKGKGIMHTWFLVERTPDAGSGSAGMVK